MTELLSSKHLDPVVLLGQTPGIRSKIIVDLLQSLIYLFSFNPEHSFGTQLKGTLIISAFAFVFAYAVFYILKITIGVRVSEEEEERGLDISEHGQEAYGS